ncbi:unnamed protein product [Cladocopium goreaui]|uniref:Uncharacterized protein n=1 Tax=Cladocopium goreaui TaxID=2562237 RepID=A0A9P1FY21_9DINO|nr:unnamed protein product [Cladocopium goreaui]
MGLKCLAGLLGIGQARLRRATTCTPDLRFGKKEHRFKAGTWSADAFFQIAYDSLAETLPDQFIRRGRASVRKKDLDDDNASDFEEIASDVEPSSNSKMLRYGTFSDVYRRRWQDILRFRSKNLFTSCEVCYALKQGLGDKTLSLESKLQVLKEYRSHLHSQYCDRTVIWRLQAESAEHNSEVLLISTDGLDQSKFALPREPELRNNALRAKYQRPRVKVHGAWAFGYTLNVYILDEVAKHDSSAILEILSQTIEDVTGLL